MAANVGLPMQNNTKKKQIIMVLNMNLSMDSFLSVIRDQLLFAHSLW